MGNDEKTVINVQKRAWNYSDIRYWLNPADDTCNATIIFQDKKSRLRAGILIVKDNDEILLGEEADEPGVFSLPGGGFEIGESPVEAAVREAKEEVNIVVKNAVDTFCDYCECHEEVKDWVKDNIPEDEWWYSYYTCLIIGEYDREYKGKVDEVDRDESMKSTCKFYKIKDVINEPSFKLAWKKALFNFGYINDKNLLTEDTRTQLISKSRNAENYKDQSRGKNRFDRKRYSKIGNTVKQYNQINMNDFFKKDILEVKVPIEGETNNYNVTIKMEGVVAEMQRNIKSNKNIFEYKVVVQALTKLFNTGNVYCKCDCKDFEMRFKHWSIVNNWGADDTSNDPGAGSGIANPNNDKGNGCKHILLGLSNMSWLMNVASVIRNYILYMAEHNKKAFEAVIFQKLYDIPYSAIEEMDLIAPDTNLETEKNIIDTINDWAKNRGKFKKGENKNPAVGQEKITR